MSASTALLKTEARLFRREPGAVFWIIGFPTLLVVILGLIPSFREADPNLDGRRVIDLYVPIAVLMSMILAGAQSMPVTLTTYREQGVLRRLSTTPARPAALLTAQIVIHGAAIALSVLLALAVGRLAFGVEPPGNPLGYAVAALLTALAALAIGGAICAMSRTAKIAQAVGTLVAFPLMFTAGVWAPVQVLPPVLRDILEWTPFGAASQALDQAMAGDWPAWSLLGVVAGWAVLLVAVAVRWFRWE
jgi:ABC-2 type transport system permease protein